MTNVVKIHGQADLKGETAEARFNGDQLLISTTNKLFIIVSNSLNKVFVNETGFWGHQFYSITY